MDIEENRPIIDKPATNIASHLLTLVCSRDFTLKRALSLVNKHPDKRTLWQQLDSMYQQINQPTYKVNLLEVVQHLLTDQMHLSAQNDEKLTWLINKVYEIRLRIDNAEEISQEFLQVLNKLLKIMNNLVIYIGKISSKNTHRLEESSLFQRQMTYLLGLSSKTVYLNLVNRLFDINLLLKMMEIQSISMSFSQFIKIRILKEFSNMEIIQVRCNQFVKEIMLNTFVKCLKMVKGFSELLNSHLHTILQIFGTSQKLRLLYELKSHCITELSSITCQTEQDFQLLSMIVQQFSLSPQCDKDYLSQIWINNFFNLVKNDIQINLTSFISEFEDDFLIIIYTKVSQVIANTANQIQKRNQIIYIWMKLVLTDKISEIMSTNKSITINAQILMYQFVRQILGLISPTINPYLYKLALSIYSKYFGVILQQEQCFEINNRIIMLIINQFPELLTESMVKHHGTYHECYDKIDLENYNCAYLDELVKRCFNNTTLAISLDFLDPKMSKIMLKYLIDRNIIPLTTLLDQNDIIAYTIQNDIEIHLDKYEHILQQKIINNIQKYLALISKSQTKNRYRNMVNSCLLNLLLNQLQDGSNRKLIKINEKIINLLIENIDSLLHIAFHHDIKVSLLLNSLFAFISRSLYYNVPLACNYLLMVVLAVKKRQFGTNLVQKQAMLLSELAKFCKMYKNTHKSYFLLGFASLILLSYGLPCYSPEYVINMDIPSVMQENDYFLQTVTQLISGDMQALNQACHRTENRLKNEDSFEKILKKCINLGFMRHISFAIRSNCSFRGEINQFNSMIEQIMNSETPTFKKVEERQPFDRKRRCDSLNIDDDELKLVKFKSAGESAQGFLEQILSEFDSYDEFLEYRQLQKLLSMISPEDNKENSKFMMAQRVHGKIRTIVHVSK